MGTPSSDRVYTRACQRSFESPKGGKTYRLRKTHETVEGHGIGREIGTLDVRNAEGVVIERETSDVHIVRDRHARDLTRPVGHLELLANLDEARRAAGAEEGVVALHTTKPAPSV